MYGSRSTGTLGSSHTAPVHRSQLYAGSRAQQHYPRHGSTARSSGPERYAQPEAQDQSWYRVERPNYHHGPHDDHYSEDGDRHSEAYGAAPGVHLISESSRVDSPVPTSPVPTVHRHGAPGPGSRLYEQFAASTGLPPSAVTHVDIHEDVPAEDYEGFDRPQRSVSAHSNPQYHAPASHHPLAPRLQQHSHRRPLHHAFQGPVRIGPTSDSSRSDVVQALDNGSRITIPRHSPDRGRSEYGSQGRSTNLERTYYIVPPGMNVIFRDEYGNELKRVGDFNNDGPYEYDEAPLEIADERGRIVYKTGENHTDDSPEANDATYRPKVVHLGQYVSNGSVVPRASSPITVSLDRRGYHRHIQLEHSEDGSFGGSQGSERSLSPHVPHAHAQSDGNLSGHPHPTANYMHRPRMDQVRLRTIYP